MYERFSQQSVQSGSADEKVSQQDKEVAAATVEGTGEAAPYWADATDTRSPIENSDTN